MRSNSALLFLIVAFAITFISPVFAHDIPKQRVDRTIQLTFDPGLLRLEYSLELDDTTIAADLRRLKPSPLPSDPEEWLSAYGKIIAGLLPQAFRLTSTNSISLNHWRTAKIERLREQHTIYEITYEISLPETGTWKFSDQNFQASEGLSRLGVNATKGVDLKSAYQYPKIAKNKAYQPVWMLDEDALKRTTSWQGNVNWQSSDQLKLVKEQSPDSIKKSTDRSRFTILGAFLLGLWHTLQPGHGKSWLMASSMLRTKDASGSIKLICGWAFSHFIVLIFLAASAWFLPMSQVAEFSNSLRLLAALLIACPAADRLGQVLAEKGNYFQRQKEKLPSASTNSFRMGIVAGMVPCWEAVGLLLLGVSFGHPLQGLLLVLCFVSGSIFVMIILIMFADFIMRHFTIGGFLGYIFNMAMNLVVLAAGLRMLWQSGNTG